ncbi:MAG: hypothetical protein GXY51_03035 [Bacteroidetes bacterium]|jgi:predicted choloylglycine hydrolase|nr:hypothetical protein [Bacteroidota bacterium]
MNPTEIKKLILKSQKTDCDTKEIARQLEAKGVSFDFSKDFNNKILSRLSDRTVSMIPESDFTRTLNTVFYRIAITGIAAIVFLMISIYLMEGSVSINSLLGMGNLYDESVLCLLTGI